MRLQSAIDAGSTDEAVSEFAQLRDLHETLSGTSCSNLLNFVRSTLAFWQNILREKLARCDVTSHMITSTFHWNDWVVIVLLFVVSLTRC